MENIKERFADEMAKVNWDTKSDGVLFKIIAKHLSESTDNVVKYNRKCDKYLLSQK